MKPSDDIRQLHGVGSAVAQKLEKLDIRTVADLLFHYPRRYDDFSRLISIGEVSPGQVSIRGQIEYIATRRTRRHRPITEAIISDDTGEIKAIWFNQPYLGTQFPTGSEVYISGELAFRYQQYAFQNPAIELVSSFPQHTARIVPVHPLTEGVSPKLIRRLLTQVLDNVDIEDPIPEHIRDSYGLIDKTTALREVHFPGSQAALESARYRLGFEEVYVLLLAVKMIRSQLAAVEAPRIETDIELAQRFSKSLAFQLTDSQRKAGWRILQHLQQEHPMNCLLQGDVGSGKTVVAALAALMCIRQGCQVALLAPTEVLAQQHAETIRDLVGRFEADIELLVGSLASKERERIRKRLQDDKPLMVIGTHALLQKDIHFGQLGLLIIDEQHRFGVRQRQRLQASSQKVPHTLSMSATPIPRSLALTVYGDLDIVNIRELPPGRKPVETRLMDNPRMVYSRVRDHIEEGSQVFVVCPLIEDSDKLGVTSVEAQIKQLKRFWKGVRIEGLHGRMKSADKNEIMRRFEKKEIDVLVSTTVIEVGVDISGADVMLIEGAERFGLATLHQLRGRVGRRGQQAYCYLKPTQRGQAARRLQLLERYHDGFVLAEKDLEIRGAGQLYGERQHGQLDLRIARLGDSKLIEQAQYAAEETGNLEEFPQLNRSVLEAYKLLNTN